MSTSEIKIDRPVARDVVISGDMLGVVFKDDRRISVPLTWFPRLLRGSAAERRNWRLIGRGAGVHWEDLDEDISVEGLLAGRPSGESRTSLKKWLAGRAARRATRSPSTSRKSR